MVKSALLYSINPFRSACVTLSNFHFCVDFKNMSFLKNRLKNGRYREKMDVTMRKPLTLCFFIKKNGQNWQMWKTYPLCFSWKFGKTILLTFYKLYILLRVLNHLMNDIFSFKANEEFRFQNFLCCCCSISL